MLRDSLSGRRPPPVRARPRAAAKVADLLAPRTLVVANVARETDDAVSITLEDPSGAPIEFRPGQFFTLLVPIGGETLRRAYSASSDARDTSRVTVTVKRVAGGRVSTHLNESLREGDRVSVLGPSGSFVPAPSERAPRHLVLIGGGSGITPLMAIARAVLACEPETRVSLLYGNRAERDVIFRRALDELAAEHGERFVLRHVLESPPPGWTGGTGRLDREVAAREIARLDTALDRSTDFFVCGPEPMREAVRAALSERGIDAARIHKERFASPASRAAAPPSADAQLVTIRTQSGDRAVEVAAGQTILEAGLAAGVAMPFSCAMGGCGACKVRLTNGDAAMEEPSFLTREEIDEGFILACASRPRGACTVEIP